MAITFITGSLDKYEEARRVVPELVRHDLDLTEVQEIDAQTIIAAKIREALKYHPGPVVVEDTSLYIDSLNGLPGPLIKWFMKTIGNEGVYRLVQNSHDDKAEARVTIGYTTDKDHIHFFEGSVRGRIVAPRGNQGFGWDALFQPGGEVKTFGEMTPDEKENHSMRKIAFAKLREFLK